MNNKLKVGILFCGGCNSYFDREFVYNKLKSEYDRQCVFLISTAGTEDKFDVTVVINGCQSECLLDANYNGKFLLVNNLNHKEANEQFGKLIN